VPESGKSLLLIGESWFSHTIHQKGFDSFTTSTYEEGCGEFRAALEGDGWTVTHIPCHSVEAKMPDSVDKLRKYNTVVLSDVGSNTFLLGRKTFLRGEAGPDYLDLLRAYVEDGGGLVMVGGYMSFSGIDGKAGYARTCLADVLPVEVAGGDDRIERPAGVVPELDLPGHEILRQVPRPWPALLGYNRVSLRSSALAVARCGPDPLLAVGQYGAGRSAAFTSDLGPHWAPLEFTRWPGYARLWANIASWVAGTSGSGGSDSEIPGQEL